MWRSLVAVAVGLSFASWAGAQCDRWYPPNVPAHPYRPAIHVAPGAPAKRGVVVEEDVPPRTAVPARPTEPAPKIAKPARPIPEGNDFTDRAPAKVPAPTASETIVEQFVVPVSESQAKPGAIVRVGFFNHSDREIALEVNGEALKLPTEQYVTLKLPRTFAWSVRGKKTNEVVVPPDADGIEIVFRKSR